MSKHEKLTEQEFGIQYVQPYRNPHRIYNNTGWIVWRKGTGLNTELLHIRTFEPGNGHGRLLFYDMLDMVEATGGTYHSVYGFTNSDNTEAQAFYSALGFGLYRIPNVYKTGTAILFSQKISRLKQCRKKYEEAQ